MFTDEFMLIFWILFVRVIALSLVQIFRVHTKKKEITWQYLNY